VPTPNGTDVTGPGPVLAVSGHGVYDRLLRPPTADPFAVNCRQILMNVEKTIEFILSTQTDTAVQLADLTKKQPGRTGRFTACRFS
jgi:hypothetical protein